MASADELISGEVSVEDLKELLQMYTLYDISRHTFHDLAPGPLAFVDMPLLDMPTTLPVIKCVVETMVDIEGPIPKDTLTQILSSECDYTSLPPPYGLKKSSHLVSKVDLAIIPQVDEKYAMLKIINFKDKVKTSDLSNLLYGDLYVVDWKNQVKHMKKHLHFIFEQLGGFQCRHHDLRNKEDGRPDVERTEEEWNRGFDFIEEFGPREHIKNKQLRWITIQTSSPTSPIYKWNVVLVEKSLRNLGNDGVLAALHEEWPLTLWDIDNRILRLLAPLFPSFVEKAIGFHGVPGAGKTPLARTIAMAVSRHWIKGLHKDLTPSFRQASEFDFFRGQCGQLWRPDIFDDGSLVDQPLRKVKAFTDIGNIESMSKERWGAAKWAKGQLRIYCCNDFDDKMEPKDDLPIQAKEKGMVSYVSHEAFMKMLDCAWCTKDNNDANIMAVLKRTHIIVNTNTFLYVRPAGEEKSSVLRKALGSKADFLQPDSRNIYDLHRKGDLNNIEDMDSKLRWEALWMEAAMKGKPVDELPTRPVLVNFRSPFADAAMSSAMPEEQDMYSSQQIGNALCTAAEPSPASSPPHPKHLSRKRTFEKLSSSSAVIEIGDSPVRPFVQVKQEQDVEAKPSSNSVKEDISEQHEDTENHQDDLVRGLEETMNNYDFECDVKAARHMHKD